MFVSLTADNFSVRYFYILTHIFNFCCAYFGVQLTSESKVTCFYFDSNLSLTKCNITRYNDQLSALRSDLRSCKRKTALQQKQIAEQQKQIAEQQKQTLEYANRLDDYDKKNEETSRKFQTLLQVCALIVKF